MHLHIKTSIKNNLKKCKAKKKKDENYYDRQHSQYPDLLQNLYTQVTFTSNLVAENWGSGLI